MRGEDEDTPITDIITKVAEGLRASIDDTGESRSPLRVTEHNGSSDAVLNCSGESLGGEMSDLCSLAANNRVRGPSSI